VSSLVRAERPADPAAVADTTVAGILRHAAQVAPDAVALITGTPRAEERRQWTYAALHAEAATAAAALRSRFAPGERVAAWGPSVPESLVLSYAAAMAGLVLVPANPAWRAPELAHVLRHSQAAGVFYVAQYRGEDLGARLASVRAEVPSVREVLAFDDWTKLLGTAPEAPVGTAPEAPEGGGAAAVTAYDGPRPDDVAQLVYTSGTTGTPKGARLTHRGMTNAARLAGQRFGITAHDVYLDTMPLFHVGGQAVAFQICQALATNVLVGAFEPGLVLELVERERATITVGVPTMLLALIEHPDFGRRDLTSLHSVSSGGAVVPAELVRTIEKRLGVRATVVFGQTETCGFISQTRPEDAAEDKAATLGWPLPGVAARVVRPEDGAVVGVGEVGELQVQGYNVMAGYHELDEDAPPAPDGAGWLHTGDLVTMDDRGYLRIVGRRSDMIIRGGENIAPAEVEAVLRAHPDVADVAVVAAPDRHWGEVPVAFVRPMAGAAVVGAELEGWSRERLAPFKVPRRWEIVDELPLTASGKVQKFVLARRLVDAPGPAAGGGADVSEPSR
jgi:fatty-acyl-CoA synthase